MSNISRWNNITARPISFYKIIFHTCSCVNIQIFLKTRKICIFHLLDIQVNMLRTAPARLFYDFYNMVRWLIIILPMTTTVSTCFLMFVVSYFKTTCKLVGEKWWLRICSESILKHFRITACRNDSHHFHLTNFPFSFFFSFVVFSYETAEKHNLFPC